MLRELEFRPMHVMCVFILFLSESAVTYGAGEKLIADINVNGLKAVVTATNSNSNAKFSVNHAAFTNYFVEIYNYSIFYDLKNPCAQGLLGDRIYPSSAQQVKLSDASVAYSDLPGATILLRSGIAGQRGCATLLPAAALQPDGKIDFKMSRLYSSINGNITAFEHGGSVYAVIALSVNPDDMTSATSGSNNYYVLTISSSKIEQGADCSKITSIGSKEFSIFGYTNRRSHRQGHDRFRFANTKLADINSIRVSQKSNKIPAACGPFSPVTERSATSRISMKGVIGEINFRQKHWLLPTIITVNLTGLKNEASGYHVHEWPVPPMDVIKASGKGPCEAVHTAGHTNPFGIRKANSPATNSQGSSLNLYETGDLSGKFGVLDGKSSLSANYTDWNLQMFGINSIIGRSVVVHYKANNGARWACGTISNDKPVVTAVANFRWKFAGQIWMQQQESVSGEAMDTWVYGRLLDPSAAQESKGHNFHVHEDKIIAAQQVDATARCASPHYSPFVNKTAAGTKYTEFCSSVDQLACEVGDLSAKGSTFSIVAQNMLEKPLFYTDISLDLYGKYSVVGRSIVVHAANKASPRVDCADIEIFPSVNVKSNDGGVSFSQVTPYDATILLQGTLSRLLNKQSQVTIVANGVNKCSSSGTASDGNSVVYNPFQVSGSTSAVSEDQFPVGNLSVSIRKQNTIRPTFAIWSSNIPLYGADSVSGHYLSTTGSSSSCRPLNLLALSPAASYSSSQLQRLQYVASFGDKNSSLVSGHVSMIQYNDRSSNQRSETLVLISLKLTGGSGSSKPTSIHVSIVSDCTKAVLYNPFKRTSDNTACGPYRQLACPLGDLGAKMNKVQGPLFISSGSQLDWAYTDINLPLDGNYQVKAMGVKVSNANGKEYDCALLKKGSPKTGGGGTSDNGAIKTTNQGLLIVCLFGIFFTIICRQQRISHYL